MAGPLLQIKSPSISPPQIPLHSEIVGLYWRRNVRSAFPTLCVNVPPPLPQITSPEANPNPFARQAALFCLLAPFVGIAVNAAVRAMRQGSSAPIDPQIGMLVGLVSLGLIVLGLIFGIVALAGMRTHGRQGIFGRAVIGILLNGLLLGLVVVGFISSAKKAKDRAKTNQSFNQVQRLAREYQADLKKNFEKEGVLNPDSGQFEKLRKSLDQASQDATGPDAAIAKGSSAYLGRMQLAVDGYQKVLARMQARPVLEMAGVTQKQDLQPKRDLVGEFLVANEKLTKTIASSEALYESELGKAGVPPDHKAAALKGFRKRAQPRNVIMMKIRETDKQLGEGMLELLSLLETHWGIWKVDQAANVIRFDDEPVGDKYNSYLELLDTISTQQSDLQRELVNLK